MDIRLSRLPEVDPRDIIELMNHPAVRRLMPLTKDGFDEADCRRFVAGKEAMWSGHGYGPWAFVVDGAFAGTPQGSCMARALRGAQFPQFASSQLRVVYPFAL